MATVRISKQLLSDVNDKIEGMAQMAAKDSGTSVDDLMAKAPMSEKFAMIEDAMWGEHVHLRAVIPADWCNPNNQFDVYFHDKEEDGGEPKYFWNPYIDVAPKATCPPSHKGYRPTVRVPFEVWSKYPALNEILAQYAAIDAEKQAIQRKYRDVRVQVKAFLESCKSLADAAKKWPGVLLYIPDSYKREMERVVIREKREKEEDDIPDFDLDALTSLAAGHMLGGNN